MLTQTNRICQNAAEALTRGRWDWEIVFEEIWQGALLKDGHAHIGDLELAALVVPAAHALSLDVFEKLKGFAVAGGQVIFLGALPSICIDEGFDIQERTLEILALPNVTQIETDRDDSWGLFQCAPLDHINMIVLENLRVNVSFSRMKSVRITDLHGFWDFTDGFWLRRLRRLEGCRQVGGARISLRCVRNFTQGGSVSVY